MFTDQMPDCHNPQHITILRASGTKRVQGMLAGEPVRTQTHWFNGKTLPCCRSSRVECPLCSKNLSTRYYAYYPLRNQRGLMASVELTATAEEQLNDFLIQKPAGTVPIVTVTRPPGKRNNPLHVEVEFRAVTEREYAIYSEKYLDPDLVKRALCRLWGVPEFEPGAEEDTYLSTVSNYLELVMEGKV